MATSSSGFNFIKFYFTIVAIISIVGMAVAFGIAIYQQGMYLIISDSEYIQGRSYRELQQCEQSKFPASPEGEILEPSAEEVATCKQEALVRIRQQRSYDTKEATIGGVTWGIIFLILFLTHYPRMIATQKETHTKQVTSSTPRKKSVSK